ncbi:Zinc finger, SWIM-type [Sesbania bispinosa]|nr:Zinc finger, SWIM-type [Sesbania bispinosa]
MILFMNLPSSRAPFLPTLICTTLLRLTLLFAISSKTKALVKLPPNVTFPAVLVFGDSIMDTGNNNNMKTLARCNFEPYGKDFQGGTPTGRFSNGKVSSDIVVEELGIKELLPAYLDPNLQPSELATGVCFASGGAGYDPFTAQLESAIPISGQLDLFKEYIGKLKGLVGEERTNFVLANSFYLVVLGSNDISNSYFLSGIRQKQYDFPTYADLMVSSASNFYKELYELGARRIGVFSAPPIGCVPFQRTMAGGIVRNCVDNYNDAVVLFNSKLSKEIDSINQNLPDSRIVYIDVYNPLLDIIVNNQKYGYTVGDRGCCGTGTIEIEGSPMENHGYDKPDPGCVHLLVHFVGKTEETKPLLNIDPDRYSYIDFVGDVCGLANAGGCQHANLPFALSFCHPGSHSRIPINTEYDVLDMFRLNSTCICIHVYGTSLNYKDTEVGISDSNKGTNNCDAPEVVISESDDEWRKGGESQQDESEGIESDASYIDVEERKNEDSNDELSDYEEKYDLINSENSDEDKVPIYFDRGIKGKLFVHEPDGKVKLEVGLLFLDVNEFRAALRDFVILEGFEIERIKNEKARVTARCAADGCSWRIHASPTPDWKTYKIKTYNPVHSCIRTSKNSNATSTWIATKLEKPSNVIQLYRARQRVRQDSKGAHAISYNDLPAWANLAKETNPGSLIKLELEPRINKNPEFKSSVPEWRDRQVTIMSDMQKGLRNAVVETFPYAKHRYCCNHLLNNFKLNFRTLILSTQFWAVAMAFNEFVFEKALDKLRKMSNEAANWLLDPERPKSMWARHTIAPECKSDHVTNNVCESFNSWLGDDRKKTILSMLESITCRLMGRFQRRYEKGCGFENIITPKIRKMLDITMQDGRVCRVTYAGDDEFQVKDGFTTFVVNLRTRTCGCNYWMLSGLPCKHACACIAYKRANVEMFCDNAYSTKIYCLSYTEIIHPMPELDINNRGCYGKIDPPTLRRLPGRPRINRKRSVIEGAAGPHDARRSNTVKCGNCKEFGHNILGCQRDKTKRQKKLKVKRGNHNDATNTTCSRKKQQQTVNEGYGTSDQAMASSNYGTSSQATHGNAPNLSQVFISSQVTEENGS